MGFLSIFMAISYQPPIFFVVEGFFEEPCQIVHLGVVEGRVWFTSSKMLHRKYIENYCNELFSISKFTIRIDALHNIRCCQSMS